LIGSARDGGSGRRANAAKTIELPGRQVGGHYFAFGEVDVFAIFDMPDSISAAAVALAVNQTGVVTGKTVVRISPEDMDKAAKKSVDDRPPGR
jgi:uncharacterized protein with GYD domain